MDSTYAVTITAGSVTKTFSPQTMTARVQDVDYDAGRAADGTMHRNKVAEKRKYDFTLPPMHTADLKSILSVLVGNDSFTATIPDPVSSTGYYTGTFYRGDISCPCYNFSLDLWEAASFNIVEF